MRSFNYQCIKASASFALFSTMSACVYMHHMHSSNSGYLPVFSNGVINKSIIALAEIQNPQAILPSSSSLAEWNTYLQKNFLRPSNVDHQEMANLEQEETHKQMEPLFDELGMVKSIYPQSKKYDLLFVFGGTPEHTKARYECAAQNIIDKKIAIPPNGTITYINGKRKIAESEVAEAEAMGIKCEYQHECAKLIWEKYYKHLPINLEIITIDPPEGRRANSDDTLRKFFAEKAPRKTLTSLFTSYTKKQRILGFSDQPYVPFQGETAKAVAESEGRDDLNVEVVGKESDKKVATITYRDSIARRVFTANTLEQLKLASRRHQPRRP